MTFVGILVGVAIGLIIAAFLPIADCVDGDGPCEFVKRYPPGQKAP